MTSDLDPDLELVRKLHLELNGSGRRTRGIAPKPAKRFKREGSRQASEGLRETPTGSRSGSGSGSGSARVLRREGTLKRLVKKQPDTDSNHHNGVVSADDDMATTDPAVTADLHSLEPQASTRADTKDKSQSQQGGDVGSWRDPDFSGSGGSITAADNAVKLARTASARDAGLQQPRVKCFYQGCLYGFSFAPQVLTSRIRLADALKAAHAADDICSAEELQIVALDGEGKQSRCSPQDGDGCWQAAVRAAKRVYVTSTSAAHI